VKYRDKIEELQEKGLVSDAQAEQLSDTLHNESEVDDTFIEEEMGEPRSYGRMITGVVVLALVATLLVSYNGIVTKEENTKTAWSQVESNLQRKLDLLPNLVKVVKQYAKHEKEVFTEVTALRAKVQTALKNSADAKVLAQANSALQSAIGKMMLVSERYPELKSSEHFLQLQSQIEGSENRINITRMMFNDKVSEYNGYIRRIPAKWVANMADFKAKEYFKAEAQAHKKFDIGI